jgi:hypothetical protein
LFSDALGSTIAMADDGANALARHYNSTPDGVSSNLGTGATTNLLFASGHQVGNLYRFGARYYDRRSSRENLRRVRCCERRSKGERALERRRRLRAVCGAYGHRARMLMAVHTLVRFGSMVVVGVFAVAVGQRVSPHPGRAAEVGIAAIALLLIAAVDAWFGRWRSDAEDVLIGKVLLVGLATLVGGLMLLSLTSLAGYLVLIATLAFGSLLMGGTLLLSWWSARR